MLSESAIRDQIIALRGGKSMSQAKLEKYKDIEFSDGLEMFTSSIPEQNHLN
jgi:hypothetical protein